jgi:hypothetical protein
VSTANGPGDDRGDTDSTRRRADVLAGDAQYLLDDADDLFGALLTFPWVR